METWQKELSVGDTVCDCRFLHLKIVSITEEKYDRTFILEDGSHCSVVHCVSLINHEWEHPTPEQIQEILKSSEEV